MNESSMKATLLMTAVGLLCIAAALWVVLDRPVAPKIRLDAFTSSAPREKAAPMVPSGIAPDQGIKRVLRGRAGIIT